MLRFIRKLVRDKGGVAASEFAIWTTALFLTMMTAMDFAGFYMQRSQINEALSAAAVSAFKDRDNVNFNDVPTVMRKLAENQSLAVTLSCNGTAGSCTNFSRTCACLRTDGSYAANACGGSCTGSGVTAGSTAGYYMSIEASQPYEPILVPVSVLGDKAVSQSVTVRLQ